MAVTSHQYQTLLSRLPLSASLFLVSILAFAPLSPIMPLPGLDPSWMLAMDQAAALKWVFGKDIIFTYGPYASVFTKAYHPDTYFLTLSLGLLLGLGYGALLLLNVRAVSNLWLWLFAAFLLLGLDSRDALFYSYPLLVPLLAVRATLPETNANRLTLSPGKGLAFMFAVALLGIFPIVKGSLLLPTVYASASAAMLFWMRGNKTIAALCVLLPVMTMAVFWSAAGQSLSDLPTYFRSMSDIVSGYTEAMSLERADWMVALYVVISALLLAALARERGEPPMGKAVGLLAAALFLFISFKAGFVRYDSAHDITAACAPILVILALNGAGESRLRIFSLLLACVLWVAIDQQRIPYGPTDSMHASLRQMLVPTIKSVIAGGITNGSHRAAYQRGMAEIRSVSPIRKLEGGTDIYPFDQAALIASGNQWVSRPILQSYSAYTPELIRINEAHLRGLKAPENIVFRVAPIDNRYPSLADGLSWPTLLSHYRVTDVQDQYAYLKRRQSPSPWREKPLIQEAIHKLGKVIPLPAGEGALFAKIDVQPTLLGKLATILFKPTPLYVIFDLSDGREDEVRFIPSMARTGFVISPYVATTADFVTLAKGDLQGLSQVRSIRIAPRGRSTWLWKREYRLSLTSFEPIPTPRQDAVGAGER